MNNLFDAFISYGRADSKAFATKLQARLLEEGLKVWFDQNDIPLGVDFQNQIDDGIEKAHNFLFLIAPHSVKSAYCLKEIQLAVKRHKRIIPLLHVEPNDCWDKMHPTIGKINWVYFREEQEDFEAAFSGLISLIRSSSDYVEQHTRFLAKALEWERYQKQNNCLLIGEERLEAEAWLKIRFKDEQPPCVPTDLHCEFISESTKNANNLMTQVFLCYSDKDKEVMKKLAKTLRREGFTVWTNKTDIKTGTDFQEEVNKGIEGTDNVVCLISSAALQSGYWQQEVAHAFANNKRIIPLLIEPTELDSIPPHIRALQFIDFTTHQDEAKYRDDADKLVKILHEDERYYKEQKILLVKAKKWQEQNRNHSILLRGHNLQYYEHWLKIHRHRREHPPLPLQVEFITSSSNQPPESSLEVFISYSRADSDFARKLNEALQIQGKTTWFDQESIPPGSDFQQEIYRGIESSGNFLFIISPRSVNSPYCADEVEYAQKLNKRFVTILHTEVSAKELPPALASVQWIDFNRHGGEFYPNFNELVRTLDTDREHVKSHTKWSQRALEWDSKDRNADLLLRGSEFAIAKNWLQESEQEKKQPAATPLQKAFIESSKNAIVAAEEDQKHRQAEMLRLQEERTKEAEARLAAQRKSARLQKLVLVRVSAALVVVSVLAVVAFREYQKAVISESQAERSELKAISTSSDALFASNKRLDALIEAIKARKQQQKISGLDTTTQFRIESALRQAVYGTLEYNRLSGHSDVVDNVAISSDGEIIASASWDKTIKLWHRNGRLLNTLQGHTDRISGVAFSPNGEIITSASWDKTIKLWHRNGRLLNTLNGHSDEVWGVAFSPNGEIIASASRDKTIKLWHRNGRLLNTLNGHIDGVYDVAFSPDWKLIASASRDKTIKLWHRNGRLLNTLNGHNDGVSGVAFSANGEIIASGSGDKTIKLWHRNGRLLNTLNGHNDGVSGVAFSPNGEMIASASGDKTIKLWHSDGRLLNTLNGHSDEVWGVTFSPGGTIIASASGDKTIKLWHTDSKLLHTLRGHSDGVWGVAFSPDGEIIASASGDKTIKLWHRDGRLLHTLKEHIDGVSGVAFSPDGEMIASASRDKTIKLWNRDGRLLHTLKGHHDEVYKVAFSPNSKMIASASWDKTIKLWHRDGRLLHTIKGHSYPIYGVSFSPDGEMIASASGDKTIKLWHRDGRLLNTLRGHNDEAYEVAFSPDGEMIASASRDKTIKLWHRDGRLLNTLRGHNDTVYGVAFSPDSQRIASVSWDKTVKRWNIDGTLLTTLNGHSSGILGVAFSPDGKRIASTSLDNTVILWDLDRVIALDRVLAYGCDWVQDYLKNNSEVEDSDRTLCNGIGEK